MKIFTHDKTCLRSTHFNKTSTKTFWRGDLKHPMHLYDHEITDPKFENLNSSQTESL